MLAKTQIPKGLFSSLVTLILLSSLFTYWNFHGHRVWHLMQLNTAPALVRQYEEIKLHHLNTTQFDATRVAAKVGIVEAFDPSMQNYTARLDQLTQKWFAPSDTRDTLLSMLGTLDLPPNISAPTGPLPHQLFTTCRDPNIRPDYWNIWDRHLFDWNVTLLDDETMEALFGTFSNGSNRMRQVWHALPINVLKTDLIRYMVLLLKGGLYTDLDTQPSAHPSLWGGHAISQVPKPLESFMFPRAGNSSEHHVLTAIEPSGKAKTLSKGSTSQIGHPDISMVIGIEDDAFSIDHDRWWGQNRSWGEEWPKVFEYCCRALQMVQWTMMAKPLHPIFLDVTLTALENLETAVNNDKMNGSLRVLELTGPGPLSDAVFRYFLAKYGVSPSDLGDKQGVRSIGDVLLLEHHSLSRRSSLDLATWNLPYNQEHPVYHHYNGTWKGKKGDPWM